MPNHRPKMELESDPLSPRNMPVVGQSPQSASVRKPDDGSLLDELIAEGLIPSPPTGLTAEQENNPPSEKWIPTVLKPRHREILRRVLEGATYVEIANDMGIHKQTVMLIATSPIFRAELAKLEDRLDHNVVARADSMANEALDKIKWLMRNARSEFIRKASAERILDTAGYSKVERKIVGIVTGEDVIRELNKKRREAAVATNESTSTGEAMRSLIGEVERSQSDERTEQAEQVEQGLQLLSHEDRSRNES